ncbi:transposase IS4 family protein [Bacillus thuringiensis HD-771]|uniref:Transposase IS4 family protein n=1 Tax=Bacillus thuringiensis HD-771 TaxID=1218175 RepID=A0A9W3J7U2_BACTU|nr:transposase IS4 family protein [Bacillus thuringiensis HD-771]
MLLFFKYSIILPPIYPGLVKRAQTGGINIQLKYNLDSGKSLHFQTEPGENNVKTFDTNFLDILYP